MLLNTEKYEKYLEDFPTKQINNNYLLPCVCFSKTTTVLINLFDFKNKKNMPFCHVALFFRTLSKHAHYIID